MDILFKREQTTGRVGRVTFKLGSVQNLSHFRSCDGGSIVLKFHLV
jgi:hypothetical protein